MSKTLDLPADVIADRHRLILGWHAHSDAVGVVDAGSKNFECRTHALPFGPGRATLIPNCDAPLGRLYAVRRAAALAIVSTLVLMLLTAGCGQSPAPADTGDEAQYNDDIEEDIEEDGADDSYTQMVMSEARGVPGPKFRSVSDSNTDTPYDPATFRFTRNDGSTVTLDELAPGKPLLLVITRGAEENLCPACTAQTARLYDAYKDFAAAGAEVVVAYPKRLEPTGDVTVDEFLQRVNTLLSRETALSPPFPIVFDVDLATVRALGIEADLAKPSTFLFGADRSLLFAYIGESVVDRPDIESLLAIVRRSVGAAPAATTQSNVVNPNAAADSKTNG